MVTESIELILRSLIFVEKEEETEYQMDVLFYMEWLARAYKERAEQSGNWRHYLQVSVQ